MKVVPLIWCIMKGTQVDVARIISNEMKSVALNCATSSKASLTYPGLIMGLLKGNGVDIPESSDEDIMYPIDDTFIRRLVKREQRATQYHVSDDEATTSAGTFDFSTTQSIMSEQHLHNQYVRAHNSFIMDQNEAIYRSNQGIHQSVYNAHVYPGNAEYPIMTPEMYQTFVHWPEGRPGPYVGASDGEDTEEDVGRDDVDLDMGDEEEDQEFRHQRSWGRSQKKNFKKLAISEKVAIGEKLTGSFAISEVGGELQEIQVDKGHRAYPVAECTTPVPPYEEIIVEQQWVRELSDPLQIIDNIRRRVNSAMSHPDVFTHPLFADIMKGTQSNYSIM
ncbi:hypothetical protein MTR_3g456010 [Medicago truncatula]|uniref:Uncharacterized protein n=1 Tax=Medicago truncatula TaxID=3880 RepID=A0A072V743_MEDTR|nr:hypothetical protein MTR_3g456010 [Medicago truncatula]